MKTKLTKPKPLRGVKLAKAVSFHPITAKDALDRWDAGDTVFTIEMGGLGPGYEQAIQILAFEMIRDNLDTIMPKKHHADFESFGKAFGDTTVSRIDKKMGGYSGAMVGAAKQIAYRALRDGWANMLESIPQDRKIQVSKNFPTP